MVGEFMQTLKKILNVLGPGFITGAADDDPTAIATYAQSGSQFGYKQLWTTLLTIPCMFITQEMSGRIGMVTGKGIAATIRQNYSSWILYIALILLIVANGVNIGADVGAMAQSGQLLFRLPFIVWILTVISSILLLQIFVGYKKYGNILKYSTIAFGGYIITAFLIKQNWFEILRYTVIPFVSFKKDYLLNLSAIVGTNISPYLFFWQASEEVEEAVGKKRLVTQDKGKPRIAKGDMKKLKIDTIIGMIFSNCIVFFIEITTAASLGIHGLSTIDSPSKAAIALKPFAGNFSFLLFSIGVLGSGFLAVPVLSSSTAYAISETFQKKVGLQKEFVKAPFFYTIIILVTLLGSCINFMSIKPFQLLIYAAALNGVLTPFLLIIILLIANNTKIMGKYTNSMLNNIAAIIIAVVMGIVAIALCISLHS